jgi:VirK protein
MMDFSSTPFRSVIFRMAFALIGARLALAPAIAAEAASYADVLGALQGGKTVTVLTDLSHCANPETDTAGPALQGGLRIQAFLVIPEKGLVFADVHQTLDPSDRPVTEYIRYNLKPDGQMMLNVERQTVAGIVKQPLLACQLAAGVRFVW